VNEGEYTWYPGCSLLGNAKSYDTTTRQVFELLGLSLKELDDWNCCGTAAYSGMPLKRAIALSGRNLALAGNIGKDMATACPACYKVLLTAQNYMSENKLLKEEVCAVLREAGVEYTNGVPVRHILDILVNDVGEQKIKAAVKNPLKDLQVACYYGCQIVRPYALFDDREDPQTMDRLLKWCGATSVPFSLKTRCCGAMLMSTETDVAVELSYQILETARRAGADCVATACPLCLMNLDGYQDRMPQVRGRMHMPVVYFTQLLAYAFGIPVNKLELERNLEPVDDLIAKLEGGAVNV
jgi:heterodisulfide reductase subunit B